MKKFFDIISPKPPPTFPEKDFLPPPSLLPKKKWWGMGLAILILAGFFGYFIFSKVEIEIWPETAILNFQEEVEVNPKVSQLDSEKKLIPGEFFEAEKEITQEFPSSGKTLKEEKSQGTIRVFNNYHLSQALVANTRFQPPLEKVLYFKTTKRIVIPAKSYLDIEVIADRTGEEYNIGPSTFSIPGLAGFPQYYSIYGKSFSAMIGGFKGEISRITEKDLDRAKNILVEKLFDETKTSLKNKIPADFILLEKAIIQEIIEALSPVRAGELLSSFNFKVRVKSKGLVFKKSDIDRFVKEFIYSQVGPAKKIEEKSQKVNYSQKSLNLPLVQPEEAGRIILSLEFSAKVYSDINFPELKKGLRGKSEIEVKTFLENQPQISKIQVKFWPFWINKIPEDIEKIRIRLNID